MAAPTIRQEIVVSKDSERHSCLERGHITTMTCYSNNKAVGQAGRIATKRSHKTLPKRSHKTLPKRSHKTLPKRSHKTQKVEEDVNQEKSESEEEVAYFM